MLWSERMDFLCLNIRWKCQVSFLPKRANTKTLQTLSQWQHCNFIFTVQKGFLQLYQWVQNQTCFCAWKNIDIKLNIGWKELFPVKIKKHTSKVFLIRVNIRTVTREGSRPLKSLISQSIQTPGMMGRKFHKSKHKRQKSDYHLLFCLPLCCPHKLLQETSHRLMCYPLVV